MKIKQLSIFVENTSGRLAEITGVLAKESIDIRALCIADTTDFGILRLIVSDPDKALALCREAGMTVSVTEVIGVELEDHPGGLYKVLKILADENIGVEYVYAFVTCPENAYVILRVEDNDRAAKVLAEKGVHLLTPDEVAGI